MIYQVKRNPYITYDVKVGDVGTVVVVRYQGSSAEVWLFHVERSGEEHWFRPHELEPVG